MSKNFQMKKMTSPLNKMTSPLNKLSSLNKPMKMKPYTIAKKPRGFGKYK